MSGNEVRILFMGTPEIAAATLRALASKDGARVIGAVTQPDRKKGRGMHLVPSEVKVLAGELGVPVFQPETLRDGAFEGELSALDPDLIVVAAYGKILPPYIINYPKLGCVCAHASILPKYRGAAPINRAVMNGESETGVTAMFMDEGIDTGDIILTLKTPIDESDTAGTVHDRLAVLAGDAMCRVVDMIRAGSVPRAPQPEEGATYAAKIAKEDCIIDFTKTAREVRDLIRGLSPFPGALTTLPSGRLLKVTGASLSGGGCGEPGEVISTDGAIRVACADGAVDLTEVVPEGKGRMDAASFVRGRGVFVGDKLGNK